MDWFLLRHGIAIRSGTPGWEDRDDDRPLTDVGRRRTRRIARRLHAMKLKPTRVLVSPLLRAKQTAEIVAEAMGIQSIMVEEPRLAATSARDIIAALSDASADLADDANLWAIGHEPTLSQAAAAVAFGRAVPAINLRKAGLIRLSIDRLSPTPSGTLEWLLPPKVFFDD